MDDLTVELDPDLGGWSARSGRPAPVGGLASLDLDSAARLHVDAVTGEVLELEVDTGPGALPAPATTALLQRLVEGAVAGDGRLVAAGTVRVRAEVVVDLAALALLERAAVEAVALGEPSPWWDVERRVRRRRLGLPDVEPADDDEPDPTARPVPLLAVPDDEDLEAELALLAEEAGVRTEGTVEVPVVAARRRTEERAVELGRLPAGDGVVHVDPTQVPRGLLDLRNGCRISSGEDPHVAVVRAPVAEVYAAQVATVVAVVLDAGGVPVAVAPLRLGPSGDGRGGAVGHLLLDPERDRTTARLVLTDAPWSVPSVGLADRRSRAHLARSAARAARLGDRELGARLWARAVDGTGAGDRPFEPLPVGPFAGDLHA